MMTDAEFSRIAQLLCLADAADHPAVKSQLEHVYRRGFIDGQIAAAPQWQPIETAPDNMTNPVAVRWLNREGEESREFDYKEDGCWMGWHDHAEHVEMIGGHGVSYAPPYEHWMPLPAAPKE